MSPRPTARLQSLLAGPSYECVHFAEAMPKRAKGVEFRRLDGASVVSKHGLFEALAAALSFPDWSGENWDAAAESLRDLDWLRKGSLALVVTGAGELWREAPALASGLQTVWLGAAGDWAERGVGFHLVFVW
jgi:barstar (barnase inhibitor)